MAHRGPRRPARDLESFVRRSAADRHIRTIVQTYCGIDNDCVSCMLFERDGVAKDPVPVLCPAGIAPRIDLTGIPRHGRVRTPPGIGRRVSTEASAQPGARGLLDE